MHVTAEHLHIGLQKFGGSKLVVGSDARLSVIGPAPQRP